MEWLTAIVLITGFTLLSGFNDGGNLLAAFVNTRIITVPVAILMILVALVAGPLLFGTAVARTIGEQIVSVPAVGLGTLNIGLAGALATLGVCWRTKVPTSTSFALVGGLIGAALARSGPDSVLWYGLLKVALSLILAVILGTLVGFLVYLLMIVLLRRSPMRLGLVIGNLQYFSSLLVCLGYGANDAEKSVGLLATVVMVVKHRAFHIADWMIVGTMLVFGIGIWIGGWRIAKTIGFHVFRARPVHAFATQLASAAIVLTASAVGGPVSSTQTVDSALIGVGVRVGKSRVRWSTVRRLGLVWVITLPAASCTAYVIALLFDLGRALP